MMIINGLVISGSLERLLDKDYSHSPPDPEEFSRLVKPILPENTHHLIKDFKFYPKDLIESETMGLYRWLGDDSEIMCLGKEDKFQTPGNLDPTKAILIGDFGWGSDMGIALDYRQNIVSPRILIDVWGTNPKTDNRWVTLTETVNEFLQKIGYIPDGL